MRHLIWAFLALPLAAAAQPDQPPAADRDRVLKAAGELARAYVQHLPDFVCVRVTQHFTRAATAADWKLQVKVSEELSYYNHIEHYKVVAVDDKPSNKVPRHIAWTGFVHTAGNFGDLVQALFKPDSRASFEWKAWEQHDGQRAWVFSYRMPFGYAAKWCSGILIPVCRTHDYAYHGLLYISDGAEILRTTVEPDNAPPRDRATQSTDYGHVQIAATDYLLPVADTYERLSDKTYLRNDSVYRDYRKFAAESVIKAAPDQEP